jgi:hypothetical protein
LDVPFCSTSSSSENSLLLVRIIALSKNGEVSAPGERQVNICSSSVRTPQTAAPIASSPTPSQPPKLNAVTTSSSAPFPPNDTSSARTPVSSATIGHSSPTNSPTTSPSPVASAVIAPVVEQPSSSSSLSDQPGGTIFNSPDIAVPITFHPFCRSDQSEGADCRNLPSVVAAVPGHLLPSILRAVGMNCSQI